MSLAVSRIIWLYSGFVSLGIVAGKKSPQNIFGAVLILVSITTILNVASLIVSLGIDNDIDDSCWIF